MSEKIYVFKRFERFWHWSQATLIIFMLITGFEVHGSYKLFGFETAVSGAGAGPGDQRQSPDGVRAPHAPGGAGPAACQQRQRAVRADALFLKAGDGKSRF